MKKNTFSKVLFVISVIIMVIVNAIFFDSYIQTKALSLNPPTTSTEPNYGLQIAALLMIYIIVGSIGNIVSIAMQVIGFITSLARGFKKEAFTWVQFAFIFVPAILETIFIVLCQNFQ